MCSAFASSVFATEGPDFGARSAKGKNVLCRWIFATTAPSCMHAFVYCAAIFCCFVWIFSMDHPFTLRLEAWSFLGCEMQNDAGASLKMGDPWR